MRICSRIRQLTAIGLVIDPLPWVFLSSLLGDLSKNPRSDFTLTSIPSSFGKRSFTFRDALQGFLLHDDLPFASMLDHDWIHGQHRSCLTRMALYALRKLFHSNELSPLQSLCRSLSRGSIISLYWSLRRLTHLGSNLPGLQPTLHCDMQRRIWRNISSGFKLGRIKGVWPLCCNGLMEPSIYACRPIVFL